MDVKRDTNYQYNPDANMSYANPSSPPPPSYYQAPNMSSSYGANTVVVSQPAYASTIVTAPVPDNMGLAVFACLFCFWPLGLVAIMRASESREAATRGDLQGAIISSNDARRYSLISIGIGVVAIIGIIIAVVVVVVNNNNYYYRY